MCKGKKPPKPSKSDAGTTPPGTKKTPCPCASASIVSQTIATSPADRTRTKVGVGEEVTLTYSLGSATWSMPGGTTHTLSPTSGGQTTFTAGDAAGSVTITATGGGCSATITLTVVAPASWTMKRKTGTGLRHKKGRPDCGWKGIVYVHPNDVNFYNIEVREKDSQYVGTGSYASYNGDYHGNYPLPDRAGPWIAIVSHSDADGSGYGGADTVYTGDPGAGVTGAAPPFKVGDGYFPIVRQWHVGTGAAHDFAAIRQEDEIFATGRCESRKAGNTEYTMYDDDTSSY